MKDKFGRTIDYLRISVTEECNLSCYYCVQGKINKSLNKENLLSFDEISETVKNASILGIKKIRLTGGEPLLRKGIVDLVRMISSIEGISDVSMTTNGILLSRFAKELKKAGLKRINISLDAIDPVSFAEKTGGGNVFDVIKGIEAAKNAGLNPIKINCVIENSILEKDALQVKKFSIRHGFQVRFIKKMDLEKGIFYPVYGGNGGICKRCNRLRLSCYGLIYPCLFSNIAYSIRKYGPYEALRLAINNKPKKGTFFPGKSMKAIGG